MCTLSLFLSRKARSFFLKDFSLYIKRRLWYTKAFFLVSIGKNGFLSFFERRADRLGIAHRLHCILSIVIRADGIGVLAR